MKISVIYRVSNDRSTGCTTDSSKLYPLVGILGHTASFFLSLSGFSPSFSLYPLLSALDISLPLAFPLLILIFLPSVYLYLFIHIIFYIQGSSNI